MTTKNKDLVVAFDVDNTLILHDHPWANNAIWIDHVMYVPHNKHISLLKEKSLTHRVIVWSQQGEEWARRIVERLGLQRFVDDYMTKPYMYFDDLPANEWMTRVFEEDK